jgi:hypothetical protein
LNPRQRRLGAVGSNGYLGNLLLSRELGKRSLGEEKR